MCSVFLYGIGYFCGFWMGCFGDVFENFFRRGLMVCVGNWGGFEVMRGDMVIWLCVVVVVVVVCLVGVMVE